MILKQASQLATSAERVKQLILACHNFSDTMGTLPPWAIGTTTQNASAHYLILPFLEQNTVFQQANGFSYNVRTIPIKAFTCPDDPTTKNGLFTGQAVAYINSQARTSDNGKPYGAATYAINAQVATAFLNAGHPTKGTTTLEKIKDGTSNTVLFAERMAWCTGPNYPSPAATPRLAGGSVTWSIWARGGRNTTTSPWADGAAAATLPPAENTAGPNGYSWWDCPLFDHPYISATSKDNGPGPRSDPNFRQNRDGVVNPGGIQGGAIPNQCDYRRLQALHTGVMTAGIADGSVRSINANISALTFQRVGTKDEGEVLGGDW